MNDIKITRRVTTTFLQCIPEAIKRFDAYMYPIVKRKSGKDIDTKWGKDVRIDPCEFDWDTKTISIRIPLNINDGIESIDDLDPNFYESIEAAFILLMNSCC